MAQLAIEVTLVGEMRYYNGCEQYGGCLPLLRPPAPKVLSTDVSRELLARSDDQLGLSDLCSEMIDLRLGLGKDVTPVSVTSLELVEDGSVFGNLLPMPCNLGVVAHVMLLSFS
jgi:hypothetical protein